MTTAQHFISFSMLAVLTLGMAPLASAQTVTISDTEIDAVMTAAEAEAKDLPADHRCARFHGLRRVICVARQQFRRLTHKYCSALEGEERRACKRRIAQHIRARIRHWIQNHCRDVDGTDRHLCVDKVRDRVRHFDRHDDRKRRDHRWFRDLPEEARAELRACRQLDTREAKRACIRNVVGKYRDT